VGYRLKTVETKRLSSKESSSRTVLTRLDAGHIEVSSGSHHYHVAEPADFTFHLRHSGSQLRITGLIDARGLSAPRLTTTVVHHAPETKAETLVRTLSRDEATPSYAGLIRIENGAQGCESYLNHHSLLIGDVARSHTVPSLEILANEVKCSHAATIRTITDEDLFYLRSRGISANEARETLIHAFLSDVQS
jgi:Fe-S cluster assembly protein SufD